MNETQPAITSARLDLVLLSPEFMEAVLEGDRAAAQRAQDFALPEGWPDETKWLGRRLAQVKADPSAGPWLIRLLVRRADARVVGHITFHAPPDPSGRAELGYTVYEPYRRQGYASEAASAMMAWAAGRGARRFVLSISPENVPSLRLADRLGFTRTGTQIDEEDGEEWVFERRHGTPAEGSREVLICARNNVHWYEAIFRTHGLSGAIADGIWTSRDNPPPYYGNAVTIAPSGVAAQLATLRDLGRVLERPWAVKDSFLALDLAPLGFQPLFDAEWIWRDPGATPPPPDRHDISWRQVTTPKELDQWEAAWNEKGSPADSRVFLPEVLANETIALFAAHRGDTVIAGCAANRSPDAVGFSNFFVADDDDLIVAGAVGEVARFGNGLPVVGYERGRLLARLLRLGFRSVGSLRVWINADATGP